ncbi:hypothetical protein UFOVP285_17 [uncultured Caudovirales phage]|uniref:Uncharacterized protein n=1 Tax=uncultured Caudovirales phage TaxID=2100421 RepID=A0A6J5LME8_9CAUD|nr:hypothetical protein UFOVP285_17 [uncultured Caudovirales phage]
MKLTIIPIDGAVGKDGKFYNGLDLSLCDIPVDVHALQWQDTTGWIEYTSALVQNQDITELPAWANACVVKWQEFYETEQAAILAAQQTQQKG